MKHPCVFRTEFHREQINPRLAGQHVPFGDFTRTWRREHCARINPYGSEGCPYAPEDCSLAFLHVAKQAMTMDKPGAWFRVHAKLTGLDRSENKPLARERYTRTYGQQAGSTGLRGGSGAGAPDVLPAGPLRADREGLGAVPGLAGSGPMGVRSTVHRPQRLGSVLRGDDPGPRTRAYGRHEEQEATDHDGDRRYPVPPPSPERLGDQPPPEDPGLHQGGE